MATESIGFVEFAGTIEPEALASAIAADAHDRLGQVVTLACDWLEEAGNALNQNQKVKLAATASRLFDGFERDVLAVIIAAVCDPGHGPSGGMA